MELFYIQSDSKRVIQKKYKMSLSKNVVLFNIFRKSYSQEVILRNNSSEGVILIKKIVPKELFWNNNSERIVLKVFSKSNVIEKALYSKTPFIISRNGLVLKELSGPSENLVLRNPFWTVSVWSLLDLSDFLTVWPIKVTIMRKVLTIWGKFGDYRLSWIATSKTERINFILDHICSLTSFVSHHEKGRSQKISKQYPQIVLGG